MSFVVVITAPVLEELDLVFSYYEERQQGLGERFLTDWEETMDLLEQRPLIYQLHKEDFRIIRFNRFPFLITFKVEENNIVVYRLVHVKQHPAKRYRD